MKHTEGNFIGVRNTNIYHQGWLPEGKAKAVILIVHGLGEHGGRYMNVVNHFVPLGYSVYAFDHIGHGKSGGAREVVVRFEDFTDNLTIFHNMVKVWQPERSLFLLGHSLGGTIGAYYLLENQGNYKGAILSAPIIRIPPNITPLTVMMGKILSTLAPKTGIVGLDPTSISRDPEVVDAYVNDPLVFHGKTPARLAAEMLRAMQHITARVGTISLPFIALQGSQDRLVDPGDARVLFEKASSKDKTLKVYEGFFHEIFNEPERSIVLQDVESWLKMHV